MLRFDKAIHLSFFLKSFLSVRLSNSLREYLYYYTFIEFIILLYTYLVTSFFSIQRIYDLSDFLC